MILLSIIVLSLTIFQLSATENACTDTFNISTCSCELANDLGTFNLSSIQSRTSEKPIEDTVGNVTLYFSFCNPIIDDSLLNCNGTASSCLDNFVEDETLNLGDASTTKLEWRTSEQFKDKQLALVVESMADKTRTVAFLVCSEGVASNVVFLATDRNIPDNDDFDTYYTTMIHADFCPVKLEPVTTTTEATPCKTSCPFDGGAFAGGIFLGLGLAAIALFGFVCYKRQTAHSNYGLM